MEEIKYLITQGQLYCIIRWAREHPTQKFNAEPMNDGEEFLSCTFFPDEDVDMEDSGYWELAEGK